MNSEKKKRLFIAIDLPINVKKNIANIKKELDNIDGIKHVKEKNIHITLKFLGYMEESEIKKIKEAIEQSVCNLKPFKFNVRKNLGAFPNKKKASIIFAQIEDLEKNIEKIFDELEKNLFELEIKKEKRNFTPHATIARIKAKKNISSILREIEIDESPEIKCDKILLYESVLKSTGAEYFVIEEFQL